jgi:hypothetical protein
MKSRALLLILCLAGLATFIWPPEVMSPAQEQEIASAPEDSGEGMLLDVSSIELELAQEGSEEEEPAPVEAPVEIQDVGLVQGSLRGRDQAALMRQGEILAHKPMAMEAYLTSTELHPGRERFLGACAHIALEQLEASRDLWRTVADADPVSSVERAAMDRLLSSSSGGPVPASSQASNALVVGLEMAHMRGELRRVLHERDYAAACGLLSNLLEFELAADWPTHTEALKNWAKQLNNAQGFHRWSERGGWASAEYVVKPGDSLVAIRKRIITDHPELNICTGLIARANQLRDENSIRPDQKLRIPLDPVHTRVDLSARFLLYYHGEEVVSAWPVTIGREGRTIPGEYSVGEKKEDPMWFPKGRAPVPFGDPENPLGTRWIAWDGSNSLGYHGTSEEDRIGEAASDGCIRLRNQDVEVLFEILPKGSPISVDP